MNDERVPSARESTGRPRVKRRVRIRVEESNSASARERMIRLWKVNSRAFVAAVILVLGIATIWLSLSLFVGDTVARTSR